MKEQFIIKSVTQNKWYSGEVPLPSNEQEMSARFTDVVNQCKFFDSYGEAQKDVQFLIENYFSIPPFFQIEKIFTK